MGQQTNTDVVDLFKEVYGNHNDLLPDDNHLAKCIPFSEKGKVGEGASGLYRIRNLNARNRIYAF